MSTSKGSNLERILLKTGIYSFFYIFIFGILFIFYTFFFIFLQGYLPVSFAKDPYSDVIRSEELDWAMMFTVITLIIGSLMYFHYQIKKISKYFLIPLVLCVLVTLYSLIFQGKRVSLIEMNKPGQRGLPTPPDSIFGVYGD